MGLSEIGIVVCLALWLVALIDILRSKFVRPLYEFLWLLAIFVVPGVGVLGYFIFGSRHKVPCSEQPRK